ncbi:hypothetical protein PHJA_001887800 [Phtheirospermum japonicum]|uniref:DUF8040 domain-containing protein n=1 Tax=Phtheirospermum japonicum TaxID=374723 RepID=A0A830C9L4_9LAMI|nr:hypothetical protein PHJA_001887800 [Phtheirospermum japonicum]
MDRNAFGRLCILLRNVGSLVSSQNVQISEMIAIFLSVLAHHKKNRVLKFNFLRSGHTISITFNHVLDETWKWFKVRLLNKKYVTNGNLIGMISYLVGLFGSLRWNLYSGTCPIDHAAALQNSQRRISRERAWRM